MKGRGISHQLSKQVATEMRKLSLTLYGKHDLLECSEQISAFLRSQYAYVPEVCEIAEGDLKELLEIRGKKALEKKIAEAKRPSIGFEVDIGSFLSSRKLTITEQKFSWREVSYPINTITGIRWASSTQLMNGSRSPGKYVVAIGDQAQATEIDIKEYTAHTQFTNACWQLVGLRLVREALAELKSGKSLRYGNFIVRDNVVLVPTKDLDRISDWIALPWKEIEVSSGVDSFLISSKGKPGPSASASYLGDWNTHVIEDIVREVKRNGHEALSDYEPS
jgi:hypothetical protein